MNLFSLFEQIRAANALTSAMDHGRKPKAKDLTALGLTGEMAARLKR